MRRVHHNGPAQSARDTAREWKAVREAVLDDIEDNLWDSALRRLEGFASKYPEISKSDDYRTMLAHVNVFRSESDSLFKKNLQESMENVLQGRPGKALKEAQAAGLWYPERMQAFKDSLSSVLSIGVLLIVVFMVAWIHRFRRDRKDLRQPEPLPLDQPGK